MDGGAFFIDQQKKQHVSRLNSWANQVQEARTASAALQVALSLEPSPHPLIRGMSSLYGSEQSHAKRVIEVRIMQHLMNLTAPAEIAACLPLARRITWSALIRDWTARTVRAQAKAART
ncbi:hypothetical protein [Paracoccus sp. T5]|uniref:hypothetical protein n=1 Tax=Paracoccus sp. T5 TaxID=3402161 RepID=UPI003ADA0876